MIWNMSGFYDKEGPLYDKYKYYRLFWSDTPYNDYGYDQGISANGAGGYASTDDPKSWAIQAQDAADKAYKKEKARAEAIREHTKKQVLKDYEEAPNWARQKWENFKDALYKALTPKVFRKETIYHGSPEYAKFKDSLKKTDWGC